MSTKYDAFNVDGCQNWKYISCDKKSPLALHEGSHGFLHHTTMITWSNLKDPSKYIKKMNAQSS